MSSTAEHKAQNDVDLDKIVHDAVATVRSDTTEPSLKVRLALFLAALVVVANSVIGIYNSISLRNEVECNHELSNALQVIGAQDRTNIQNVIDTVLSGKPLTKKQFLAVGTQFDKTAARNARERARLLSESCSDRSTPTTTIPSGSQSKPAK